jgi:hypothetical protein
MTRKGVPAAARGRHLAMAAAAVALACGLAAGAAQAGQKYGSAAIFTNRNCTVGAGTACPTGPRIFTQLNGGMNQGLDATADAGLGASGAAQVSFGDGYLPVIRVGSQAGAATRTGASVTAFRTFTYTGAQAIDLAIQGQLHFFNSGDALSGDYPNEGTLNVALGIMPLSAFQGFTYQTDASAIISNQNTSFPDCAAVPGTIAASGYNSLGAGAGEHTASIGLSSSCGGGAIRLNTGDSFVVVATLQAISNRGGFVDAMHTFTVSYDEEHTYLAGTTEQVDPRALQRSISTAPEPAAWALMIGGFGLTGGALRRRRVAT